MKSDIEIARSVELKKIKQVAESIGIPREEVENYGRYIAKIPEQLIDEEKVKKSNLVLVTAITATKAGIGKTTVSIGLALGLNKIGKKAIVALREPSLGPCFGMKGGAAGGGYAQVLPMEKINLHFTGDFHAITSAHNMISALLDNYLYQNQAKGFGRSYFEYLEFMEEAKKYVDAEQLKELEAKASALYEAKKGEKAIDFAYPDAEGNMHSLSDYKGKVVVVDVWATWCSPCRGELPHLKKLEKAMEGKDVVFIGVSVDEKKNYEKWKKFLVDEQLPGVQLFADGWSKITKDYKITGIPRFMVFAKDGSIVESQAPRPSDPSLQKMIESELQK